MKIPVTPLGGRSNAVGAHPTGAIVLDMTNVNKLVEIDEESLTVTAQAGMTWGDLLNELRKRRWTTGFIIHSFKTATLGGSVALCANGINEAKYGLVGEQVVGLEVVLPNGDIVGTGSGANTVAKKFTRYCYGSDLTGLFIGSHGILGVITEVTLKIYPFPDTMAFYGYTYESVEAAAEAMYQMQRGRVPVESIYICTEETLMPPIKAPAALLPIILAGTNEEVKLYGKMVDEICSSIGKRVPAEIAKEEAEKRLVRWSSPPRPKDVYIPMAIPFCSNIPTLQVPKIIEAVREFWKSRGTKYNKINLAGFSGHACNNADCTITPALSYDERDPETQQKVRELALELMDLMVNMGVAPHYIGYLRQQAVMWKLGAYTELLRTIKKAVDPNNIVNPGQLLMPEF